MIVQLLKHKGQIIGLLKLLVEKTKSERGYTGTGRMISRIVNTLAGTYPINTRLVNTDEWEDPGAHIFIIVGLLFLILCRF